MGGEGIYRLQVGHLLDTVLQRSKPMFIDAHGYLLFIRILTTTTSFKLGFVELFLLPILFLGGLHWHRLA